MSLTCEYHRMFATRQRPNIWRFGENCMTCVLEAVHYYDQFLGAVQELSIRQNAVFYYDQFFR